MKILAPASLILCTSISAHAQTAALPRSDFAIAQYSNSSEGEKLYFGCFVCIGDANNECLTISPQLRSEADCYALSQELDPSTKQVVPTPSRASHLLHNRLSDGVLRMRPVEDPDAPRWGALPPILLPVVGPSVPTPTPYFATPPYPRPDQIVRPVPTPTPYFATPPILRPDLTLPSVVTPPDTSATPRNLRPDLTLPSVVTPPDTSATPRNLRPDLTLPSVVTPPDTSATPVFPIPGVRQIPDMLPPN